MRSLKQQIGTSDMPGESTRLSYLDVQLVQNLVERCLQLYMNKKEAVETLFNQAKIEPGFTKLVWEHLEQQNQEFFKAYYIRLGVKQQIMEFNRLLEEQVKLMHRLHPTAVASLPSPNGSHSPTLRQNPEGPIGSSLPEAFNNGGLLLHTSMQTVVDMYARANGINTCPSALSAQSSNSGLIQGINGGMIKSEPGYSGSSAYIFGADGSVLEAQPTSGDASVTSLTSVESNSHSLNEPLLDLDASSISFLGHINGHFGLSNLTADFSQSSDILESYRRPPFLATDHENFLERVEQVDHRRLDSISEGLSHVDFGSE